MPAASFAHVLDRTAPLFFLDRPEALRVSVPEPRSRRARRELTPLQQMALETLRDAGAALAADFTEAELKVAFRRLARQVHPDMHPDVSVARRTALSVKFAEVHDAYEELLKPRT